jgi:hypothetical protein
MTFDRAGCCLDGVTDHSPYRYTGGACNGCPRTATPPNATRHDTPHAALPEPGTAATALHASKASQAGVARDRPGAVDKFCGPPHPDMSGRAMRPCSSGFIEIWSRIACLVCPPMGEIRKDYGVKVDRDTPYCCVADQG